eukprot:CAMPEP_0173399414 /NCGR_PEP_ID=MMETSP1356-20130122/44854_1 /TAXON_ID=77927 ORGANISM="Hemiselmis virescens, Strain PCC157" /NCGR_SAMPLE_ID=MMETSP1356 /ASSEMBLY_ACC=CAM_ASM_000847 /LENGTH=276 /DNA_ID=CAMNT_0014359123 /DNA_START=167 /DNA_END=994 /DNA_ORIENTATION=+
MQVAGALLGGLTSGMHKTLVEQAHKQFDTIDTDGSGTIEPDELRASLMNMGMAVTPEMITESLGRMGLGPEDSITRDLWIKFSMGNDRILSERQQLMLESRQVFEAMGGTLSGNSDEDPKAKIRASFVLKTLAEFEIPANAVELARRSKQEEEDEEEKEILFSDLDKYLHGPDQVVVNSNLNDASNPLLRKTTLNDDPVIVAKQASAQQRSRRQSTGVRTKGKRNSKTSFDAEPLPVPIQEFRKLRWLEQLDRGLVLYHRAARQKEMEKTRAMIKS